MRELASKTLVFVGWVMLAAAIIPARARSPAFIKPVILPPLPPSASLVSPDLRYDVEHAGHAASRPAYAFAYGVQDPNSGNAQSHQEQRDGDRVRGEYKVLEADGSVRTVTYTVDPKNGFQANVHHDPSLSSGRASAAYKAAPAKAIGSPSIAASADVVIPDSVDDHADHSDGGGDFFSGGYHEFDR